MLLGVEIVVVLVYENAVPGLLVFVPRIVNVNVHGAYIVETYPFENQSAEGISALSFPSFTEM